MSVVSTSVCMCMLVHLRFGLNGGVGGSSF